MAAQVQKPAVRQHLTFSREHVPAHSAASITARMFEAFPPAGNPALEADSTVAAVAFMAGVEADTGKRVWTGMEFAEKF